MKVKISLEGGIGELLVIEQAIGWYAQHVGPVHYASQAKELGLLISDGQLLSPPQFVDLRSILEYVYGRTLTDQPKCNCGDPECCGLLWPRWELKDVIDEMRKVSA